MKKKRRALERWELDLIQARQARRDLIASLNAIASRPFQSKIIRRQARQSGDMKTSKPENESTQA